MKSCGEEKQTNAKFVLILVKDKQLYMLGLKHLIKSICCRRVTGLLEEFIFNVCNWQIGQLDRPC